MIGFAGRSEGSVYNKAGKLLHCNLEERNNHHFKLKCSAQKVPVKKLACKLCRERGSLQQSFENEH